ncbi:PREDICTED: ULTRAPETALA [Prunus dulcis]|nr:PREDICTED: ULTRAPETALA [Prunus dulcis]
MARGARRSRSSAARHNIGIKDQSNEIMFRDEDIKQLENIHELVQGPNYVEVICGCTSKKYGDQVGKLKISSTGQFQINCECSAPSTCEEVGVLEEIGKLTPEEFEKHSREKEGGPRKWKSNIWVTIKGKKVPLWKSGLMRYYKHASNEGKLGSSSRRRGTFHRDEFLLCSKCKKERRFRLRTKQECKAFHYASMIKKWKCSDHPYDKIKCGDEEERASRKSCRGCPRTSTCKGCTCCVCLGCLRCRYLDCNCRICVDFMQNAQP